jgi:SAM-dependent methyltransferase
MGTPRLDTWGLESQRMTLSIPENEDEHDRWNRKYRESPDSLTEPDPFLLQAFSQYIVPLFPGGGKALDLAGGAGRHAIWLAKKGWEVTLIDISEAGVELARHNAGALATHIRFVVDDLTHFKASQIRSAASLKNASLKKATLEKDTLENAFELVLVFCYLDRAIFPEIVKAIRPGGLLVYKTHTVLQAERQCGPKNPAHLLQPGELPQLVDGLRILHYREVVAGRATAELVAKKTP